MIKQILYISLIFILLVTSCKDDPYVLKGRLMINCDYPGANKEMFIKQDVSIINSGGVIKESFYSDENGYFEVDYIPEHGGDLKLGVYGSSTVLEFIPSKENLDLGDVYYGSIPTNFVIRLEVHEPYTENDTLVFRDFHSETITNVLKIPGPFNSGVMDTIYNIGLSNYPFFYQEPPEQYFPYWISSDSIFFTNHCDFNIDLCDPNFFGDAVLVIE